jgi:16S rRNA (guanine527-N7)-methyltransferase
LQDIEQPQPIAHSPEDDLQQLQTTLSAHGISVPEDQAAKLAQYCRLLWDWNSRLNLTRHTDWEMFVTRDLLDTIELAKHIPQDARIMDVGSGGGVPGIPLAILRPDVKVSLCDSVGKKAIALKDMVKSLGLKIQVHSDRAEAILKRYHFHFVTARAVASITKMIGWFSSSWGAIGKLLLIKGPRWIDERSEAEEAGLLKKVEVEPIASWSTPGRDGQSVLLRIGRKTA